MEFVQTYFAMGENEIYLKDQMVEDPIAHVQFPKQAAATTLEWQTPETPPGHGNWGKELPVVYRWAYDYSVPGAPQDFIPQNQPPFRAMQGAAS